MSDKPYCPWCGRNMDELENGKIDGHVWYRDDSDYIQNIERSRDFMKKRIAELTERGNQLEQLCHEMFVYINHATRKQVETYRDRMAELGLLEGEQ